MDLEFGLFYQTITEIRSQSFVSRENQNVDGRVDMLKDNKGFLKYQILFESIKNPIISAKVFSFSS